MTAFYVVKRTGTAFRASEKEPERRSGAFRSHSIPANSNIRASHVRDRADIARDTWTTDTK